MQSMINIDGVMRPTCNSAGKPIHCTEEGVANFWRWFGESKLVDDEGRPLVLYHGTGKVFDAFEIERAGSEKYADWGQGIYLTPSYANADYYRTEALKNADETCNAMWSRLEEMEKQAVWSNGSPTYPEGYQDLLNAWRGERKRAEAGDGGAVLELYVRMCAPFVIEYQSMPDPFAARAAQEKARDGILVLHPGGGIDEIVSFSPFHVKSAGLNSGRFDPASSSFLDRQPEIDLALSASRRYCVAMEEIECTRSVMAP